MFQNSFDRYNTEILAEVNNLAELTAVDDLPERVPSCPEWSSRQLVAHLWQALAWPTEIVGGRHTEFIPPTGLADGRDAWSDNIANLATERDSDRLDDPVRRAEHLRALGDRLVDALRAAGPDVPVWVPFGELASRYWAHWTLFEMAVHRADIELMTGRTAAFQLAPELAIDLLDGFVIPLTKPETEPFFSPLRAGLTGTGQRMYLRAVDEPAPGEGRWLITFTSRGVSWSRDQEPAEPPEVTVRGRAAELLLLMKGRIRAHSPLLEVSGDAGLIAHWQRHAIA